MNNPFLEIDLRLLIARYGRHQVLQCLAGVGDSTVEEIKAQLEKIELAKDKKSKVARKSPEEILDQMPEISPDARDNLNKVVAFFESRVFLPELRDVNLFLERRGFSKVFKSRKDALPQLLGVLASLSDLALKEILDSVTSRAGTSDYSLLANEIMGSHRKPVGG